MKSKINLTLLAAVTILAILPILTFSQSGKETFSGFSMPQNNGTTVNSADDESGACVAPNGLSLYLSSDAPGTLGSKDLWVSQRPTLTSAWGVPQNLGTALNTDEIENLPALSLDGKTMFFTSTRLGGFGSSDIYMTTRINANDDFGWTAPVNLGPIINTGDGEIGAGYFEDPSSGLATLYFTSNRAGGLGGEDFYQSTRNANGSFNPATNFAALNSSWNDRGLQIRRDGLEVIFASDRDGGFGGRDIWVATRASLAAQWNPPVNLAAVNSSGSDQSPSLSPDGSILYLSSSRDGSSDIYTVVRVKIKRCPSIDPGVDLGDGRESDVGLVRPLSGIIGGRR